MNKRGGVSLLETIVGLCILLAVVLVVASLFPTSYQGSLQAWRFSAATNLARHVLEQQKSLPPSLAMNIPRTAVEWRYEVQGRPVVGQFFYAVERDSAASVDPVLWKVTVSWEHTGKERRIFLVGAVPAQ
jgi:Tfp pilus assembly protein PilV